VFDPVTAAIIGASVLSTGASFIQQRKQEKAVKQAAQQQEEAAAKLEEDKKRNRLQTAMRLKKGSVGATGDRGTRDTILTGPLGVIGSATGERKTLLGL